MAVILADEHIPFLKGILEPFANVIYVKGGQIEHGLAMKADGLIIRTRTTCDAALLEGTPVKFIATATIGFDHIDTDYCNKNSISWFHAPGCNASSVRQYIASALVTLALKHHFSLRGKKIGIIGVGHVGSKVAQLAEALGMIPLLNDPPRERSENISGFVRLEEIRETADIITFHVPLNPEGPDRTFHLADMNFFRKLKKKPLIINTSRGPVLETAAVKDALKSKVISGFAADVWENEPDLDLELMKMADIATPHIAGYSVEGKANGTAACVRNASRFFNFGIDGWYPASLPLPEKPVIEIDAGGKTEEEVLFEAILACYDISRDDANFRKDPAQFENLRNQYPVRREFGAFTVRLNGVSFTLFELFSKIGFRTG